jgi:DNA-binding transcriptional LysR family regulator
MSDFRLQVFAKVAQRLNLTQAAQELGISQPAVSKHIQELETQYNTQLLNRSNNRIALTPAGRLFYIHAQRILDDYGALEAEMYRISDNYCGEIRVSADSPAVDSTLFSLFLKYCKKHPCIKVSYIETKAGTAKELLRNKEIDLAFTNGPHTDDDLLYTAYAKQKWVFIAYAKGIFAEKTKASLEDMLNYKLNINIYKNEADLYYNTLLEENQFVNYYSDLNVIKYLIYKNDCVGLLPFYAVERELSRGDLKVIDIDGVTFDEEIGILTRKDSTNHAIRWFLEFTQENNQTL